MEIKEMRPKKWLTEEKL